MTARRILVLFLLTLSFASIAAADELQVSFSNVDVTKQIPAFSGTYSGSWLWDTSTNTISDVIVQSTGPADFNGPITFSAEFGQGLGQPAGTSDLFLLSILTADSTASLNFFPQDSLAVPAADSRRVRQPGAGLFCELRFGYVPCEHCSGRERAIVGG